MRISRLTRLYLAKCLYKRNYFRRKYKIKNKLFIFAVHTGFDAIKENGAIAPEFLRCAYIS
jgi:hypothetical protein